MYVMNWAALLVVVMTVEEILGKKDRCPAQAKTCSECISAHSACAWCTGKIEGVGQIRCQLKSSMVKEGLCDVRHIITPPIKKVAIHKRKPVTSKRRISPQKMTLKMRRGSKAAIPVSVYAKKKTVSIHFRHPREVKVVPRILANCTLGSRFKKKVLKCRGVTPGEIKLEVVVKMTRCLSRKKNIKLTVDGNRKKTLKIGVVSTCSCDCDEAEKTVPGSSECSRHGTLACGGCVCHQGWSGDSCQCEGGEAEQGSHRCIAPNSKEVCSGRGKCQCGFCQCLPVLGKSRYTGQYCECDDSSCDYDNGELCGGPSRGVCMCGVCQCRAGYTGSACNSNSATDNCKTPASRKICNNHGKCLDNHCKCDQPYIGRYCEDCPACPGKCEGHRRCIQCQVFRSGPLSRSQCYELCDPVTLVDDVMVRDRTEPKFRMCRLVDEDGCMFLFAYHTDSNGYDHVKVQINKMCPVP